MGLRTAKTAALGLLALALTLAARPPPPNARADAGDDILKRWLDRSDVVVDATLRNVTGALHREPGVAHYTVELEVHATLKGQTLPRPPAEAVPKDRSARRADAGRAVRLRRATRA